MKTFNQYNHYIGINKYISRPTPQQIEQMEAKGLTQQDIGEIYQRTNRMVRYWKKWDANKLQKRGRKLRIIGDTLEKLCSHVENNNTATLEEISNFLFQETGQRFSVPTIFRALERANKPLKKGTKQHINQDKEKVKQFIAENSWLLSLDSLLAIDECGFNLGAVPKYARATKGQRAVIKRTITKGFHYTLLLCVRNVNQQAIIYHQLTKEKVDTKFFHDFLEGITLFNNDNKHYLLLDNASIHHALDKRKELKLPSIQEQASKKNIEIRYLTSYAPELNPVERCFNFIKHYYRKARPTTFEELKRVVEETIKKLQQKDLRKWFKSCFDYESWHKKRSKKEEI